MKVAVAQMRISDNTENNLDTILNFINQAHTQNANLICFPEMSLTGYNRTLLSEKNLNHIIDRYLNQIIKRCNDLNICAIVGHPCMVKNNLYNRASVIIPKSNILCYDKKYPTDAELKFFSPGEDVLFFDYMNKRFGVAICRDQNYHDIFSAYFQNRCDGVFILSAHFYNPKEARWKIDKNRAIPITRACENSYYVFLSNTVGSHLGMISLGHSMIVDKDGCVVVEADEANECILYCEMNK